MLYTPRSALSRLARENNVDSTLEARVSGRGAAALHSCADPEGPRATTLSDAKAVLLVPHLLSVVLAVQHECLYDGGVHDAAKVRWYAGREQNLVDDEHVLACVEVECEREQARCESVDDSKENRLNAHQPGRAASATCPARSA